MRRMLVATAVALALAGTAYAAGPDVISLRKAGQDLLNGDFAGIRAVVAARGDVKTLQKPAEAMSAWMKQFTTLFPPGSDKGETKVLPAVWSDTAGFNKAADNFIAAADKLAQLAKAGDAEGVAAQVKVVGDACGGCHKTYRQR